MSSRLAGLRLKLLYIFFLGFLVLLPEIVMRIARRFEQSPIGKPAFHRISEDYPLRDELIRDWGTLRFQYHDYFLYAPTPAASETVTFTDYFGARKTPESQAGPNVEEVVWAFGGSTMQNLEADDDLTLANQVVKELNARGVPSRLHNFGVGSFQSSLESIRFQDLLRQVPEGERPTTAIFYDGFNDALFGYLFGAGRPQFDVSSKLSDLIERSYARVAVSSGSQWLSQRSLFWDRFIGRRIEVSLHGGAGPDNSARNLEATVNAYVVNVLAAKGICAEFRIRCLFFLQPLLATRSPLTPFEQEIFATFDSDQVAFVRDFYSRVAERFSQEQDFHDLSRFFDDSEEPVFFDLGHTSPIAGIPLGREIATRILEARN